MDVLVTGGAGFLGSRLADRLLALGHRVTIFDNLSSEGAEISARRLNTAHDATGRLTFVFRDVRDSREVERAVVGKDAIFHAAGLESEESALLDPREDFSVRVIGTFNVLEAMRARAPLAHLVLASSASVYGPPPLVDGRSTIAANERQATAPHDPYASGACCGEKYALAFTRAYGLRVTVLRLANVYGDATSPGHAGWLARLIAAARGGYAVAPPSDPRWPVDLVDVSDVCSAAVAVWSASQQTVGHVFNVGGGAKAAPSLFEVAEFLGLLGGQLSFLPPIGNARPAFVLDSGRLTRVTGWEPSVGWRDGLSRLFSTDDPQILEDRHPESERQALVAWPRAEGLA